MATVSAREFNQDVGAAKRSAAHEPLVITDRGTPAYVLLSIEDFRRLSGHDRSIVTQLRMDDESIEFDAPRIDVEFRVPEL